MIGSMSYYVHTFFSLNQNASNHTLLINTVYIVDTENRVVGCVRARAREESLEYLDTLQEWNGGMKWRNRIEVAREWMNGEMEWRNGLEE